MSLFTRTGGSTLPTPAPKNVSARKPRSTPSTAKVLTAPKVKAPTASQLEAAKRREEQKQKIQSQDIRCGIEDGVLWIEAPVTMELSKKGNSTLVSSSHGFFETEVVVNGKKVMLTFNAIIPND